MPTGFTIADTLGIIPIIWLISWASTYIGGEVRIADEDTASRDRRRDARCTRASPSSSSSPSRAR